MIITVSSEHRGVSQLTISMGLLKPGSLTVSTEKVPKLNAIDLMTTSFENRAGEPKRKNPQRKKFAKVWYRQLAWPESIYGAKRKVLASL